MADHAPTARLAYETGRTLLIGLGNPDRGDDGLGPRVIRALAGRLAPRVVCITHEGDGAALLERWQPDDRVVLVDCVRSAAAPGTIHRLDALESNIPSDFFHYSSHAFGLAEAVEMARSLGRLPSHLLIYGIEGGDYTWGCGLSPDVARAASELTSRLLDELGANARESDTREVIVPCMNSA